MFYFTNWTLFHNLNFQSIFSRFHLVQSTCIWPPHWTKFNRSSSVVKVASRVAVPMDFWKVQKLEHASVFGLASLMKALKRRELTFQNGTSKNSMNIVQIQRFHFAIQILDLQRLYTMADILHLVTMKITLCKNPRWLSVICTILGHCGWPGQKRVKFQECLKNSNEEDFVFSTLLQ